MRPCITASRFQGPPPPARFNIARHCLRAGSVHAPDKIALKIVHDATDARGDESWSYARLNDAVQRFACVLRREGTGPGDRVLIRLGNGANAAIAFLGAAAAAAVPIPVSSQLAAAEVEFIADDSGAALVVVASDLPVGRACDGRRAIAESDMAGLISAQDAADYADTAAEDAGFLIYTSGTTSRPKGVLHAQRALWGRRPMYAGWYGIGPDDVVLHAGALNWTYTLGTGLMDPLANGATGVIFAGERTPEIWPALIERVSATLFAAVPTVYRQMLKYCDLSTTRMSSLRHGLSAGETLRPEVAGAWIETTGRPIYEAFGMSEVSTYVSSAPSVPPRPGSPGRPQKGRAVALLPLEDGSTPVLSGETGVIAVHRSDPGLMLGYFNRAAESAWRGDWFVTGDLATMDEDFYVRPRGRADDVMNVFGYRVSPAEVEEAIAAHPAIIEVAAVEAEVRPGVSIIKAFIVTENNAALDTGLLLADARQRIAAYKLPREIVQVPALPRTANGKIRRDQLRAGRF